MVIIKVLIAPTTAPELLGRFVHATRIVGCDGKTHGFITEGGEHTFTPEEVHLCEDLMASYM